MHGNAYYHLDTCNLLDLEMLFKGKQHLGVMLKGRRWAKAKARIKRLDREKIVKI